MVVLQRVEEEHRGWFWDGILFVTLLHAQIIGHRRQCEWVKIPGCVKRGTAHGPVEDTGCAVGLIEWTGARIAISEYVTTRSTPSIDVRAVSRTRRTDWQAAASLVGRRGGPRIGCARPVIVYHRVNLQQKFT